MPKRKAGDLWNQANAEAAAAGTSFVTCPRCQETFNGKERAFRKHHGVGKCELKARNEADVAMDVEPDGAAAAAGHGHLHVQHSPAGDFSAEAQQQVWPEAPAEDDIWHDASHVWADSDAAAAANAAAAAAAAAAAVAEDEAFQRCVDFVPDMLQAEYTEEEIRRVLGVSGRRRWLCRL
jgi:uncharacterized C2H2 Zn-finger protein